MDLGEELWWWWMLVGDSASVQWVPPHMGASGNEQADVRAACGAGATLRQVQWDRELWDICLEMMRWRERVETLRQRSPSGWK